MRQILIFLLSVCSLFAAAQPSITDTTKLSVFDRTNAWVTTGALLKAYCAAGGGGSVATDAIWDAAGDLAVGTGANTASRLAIGTSLQQLRVNSGGTALEYFTPSASSGDLVNGGQSTGATVSYGTTDAQAAAIKTNSVERLSITGGASTGGAATLTNVTANTNTVQDVLTINSNSSGTASAGFGGRILFQGESSTTDNRVMGAIGPVWTSATDASRETDLVLYCANATATPKEAARLKGVTTPSFIIASGLGTPGTTLFQNGGITHTGVNFIVGNSSGTTSIGTSTGPVVISNTSANTISIHNTVNATNSTAGIVFGNATSFTQTSGTRNYINNNWSFSPTSGTAVHNQLSFTGTINQTGGASGIVRGINLAHTMTAAADYRAIEIADNLATAKGIYQTGALTTNNFVGKTTHGSTTAPTALLMLAAGTTAATTAPLKFTSGPVMTTPEAGAVEFLTDAAYLTTTTGTVRRMLVGSQCARATAQTAANSSIATFTTPAVDGTYEVSGHITVTTSSAEAFSLTVDYTDESNTARTATIPLLRISTGAFTVTTISASGAVTYPSATIPIRCKASTAITLKTAGTFTGCTYNVEGCIKQIN